MTKDDLKNYKTVAIVERYQSNPLSECSYHYLGESRHFSIDHMRYADLVVELYKGELRIIKNRYDESGGTLELSPDEMAKMLLAHN